MSQGESESEHDRKVREFWAKKFSIYDIGSTDFKDDRLPYEPTAVLAVEKASPTNQATRKFSIYDISSLNFTI